MGVHVLCFIYVTVFFTFSTFLSRVNIAYVQSAILIHSNSVRLPICLSVSLLDTGIVFKTTEMPIKQSILHDGPGTVVL